MNDEHSEVLFFTGLDLTDIFGIGWLVLVVIYLISHRNNLLVFYRWVCAGIQRHVLVTSENVQHTILFNPYHKGILIWLLFN